MKNKRKGLIITLSILVLFTACFVCLNHNKERTSVMFSDLMALKGKFGANAAELGISEEFMFSYRAKGKFLDYDCDCNLEFDENKIFTGYTIYVYGVKGSDLTDKLNDICSGPVSSSMTPYVESNGGAVYSTVYEDKDAIITVSKAQNNNYYSVKFRPNPNPGFFGTLTLKPAATDYFSPKNIETVPSEYDNGILTVNLTNHSEVPIDFTDDFTLFEYKESSYYSKFRIESSFSPVNSYTVLPGESLDLSLDLRLFGKPTPNEYMVKLSDIEVYFALVSE